MEENNYLLSFLQPSHVVSRQESLVAPATLLDVPGKEIEIPADYECRDCFSGSHCFARARKNKHALGRPFRPKGALDPTRTLALSLLQLQALKWSHSSIIHEFGPLVGMPRRSSPSFFT